MSLVSSRQFLDEKGFLLPGYTEYLAVTNGRGEVNKEYPYNFPTEEDYVTYEVEDPSKAYSVEIRGMSGAGRSVDLQSSASMMDAGVGALADVGSIPIAGVGVQANYARGSRETTERASTMQEMTFKVKGGRNKELMGDGPPTSFSIRLYTFSLNKAHKIYMTRKLFQGLPETSGKESGALMDVPEQAFGPVQWLDYFRVEVDKVPVPRHLQSELLQHPDRYTLVFIPEGVYQGGRKVRLDFPLGIELLSSKREKGYPFQVSETSLFPVKPVDSSRWILLTKKCFKELFRLGDKMPTDPSEQKQILKEKYASYRTPTAWEAFLAIALHRIHTGEVLYGEKPNQRGCYWMRCAIEAGQSPLVGGFDGRGLRIKPQGSLSEKASNVGMAGILC